MTAKAAQKISLWEFFQQLGKTFMLPVALLSFCGIMLGIGSSLSSKDVITLIPFLGTPVLQAIFIWRLLSLLTKWLDVGLMCGNFCYVAAIRFVMCNELTSFRGNFMPHPCPITSPDNHQTHQNAHR
jgi:phosphotransferase system  glucose/maltose/N-acetylglucosamine-specific IIC component